MQSWSWLQPHLNQGRLWCRLQPLEQLLMPQAQAAEGLAVFELFVQWGLQSHLHVSPGLQGFVPTQRSCSGGSWHPPHGCHSSFGVTRCQGCPHLLDPSARGKLICSKSGHVPSTRLQGSRNTEGARVPHLQPAPQIFQPAPQIFHENILSQKVPINCCH